MRLVPPLFDSGQAKRLRDQEVPVLDGVGWQSLDQSRTTSQPSAGLRHCRVEIEAGAADVVVRVPESMAASVRTSTALASVDVDSSRFPHQDGIYRSAGYDRAADRADIRIDGGLASFAVR